MWLVRIVFASGGGWPLTGDCGVGGVGVVSTFASSSLVVSISFIVYKHPFFYFVFHACCYEDMLDHVGEIERVVLLPQCLVDARQSWRDDFCRAFMRKGSFGGISEQLDGCDYFVHGHTI